MSLEKSADATSVQPGQELRYTLVAENTGALDLDPVVIFDRLPSEVVYLDSIVAGDAGSCTLIDATSPQLVRCDIDGTLAPGDFTPEIVLLVEVTAALTTDTPIVNQARSVGSFDGREVVAGATTDLSCVPTEGEVCDLSAQVIVAVEFAPDRTETISSPASASSPVTADRSAQVPVTVAPELPKTGSDATNRLLVIGALLVALGGAMLLTTRRAQTA